MNIINKMILNIEKKRENKDFITRRLYLIPVVQVAKIKHEGILWDRAFYTETKFRIAKKLHNGKFKLIISDSIVKNPNDYPYKVGDILISEDGIEMVSKLSDLDISLGKDLLKRKDIIELEEIINTAYQTIRSKNEYNKWIYQTEKTRKIDEKKV